jgi:hypothetical protein
MSCFNSLTFAVKVVKLVIVFDVELKEGAEWCLQYAPTGQYVLYDIVPKDSFTFGAI